LHDKIFEAGSEIEFEKLFGAIPPLSLTKDQHFNSLFETEGTKIK